MKTNHKITGLIVLLALPLFASLDATSRVTRLAEKRAQEEAAKAGAVIEADTDTESGSDTDTEEVTGQPKPAKKPKPAAEAPAPSAPTAPVTPGPEESPLDIAKSASRQLEEHRKQLLTMAAEVKAVRAAVTASGEAVDGVVTAESAKVAAELKALRAALTSGIASIGKDDKKMFSFTDLQTAEVARNCPSCRLPEKGPLDVAKHVFVPHQETGAAIERLLAKPADITKVADEIIIPPAIFATLPKDVTDFLEGMAKSSSGTEIRTVVKTYLNKHPHNCSYETKDDRTTRVFILDQALAINIFYHNQNTYNVNFNKAIVALKGEEPGCCTKLFSKLPSLPGCCRKKAPLRTTPTHPLDDPSTIERAIIDNDLVAAFDMLNTNREAYKTYREGTAVPSLIQERQAMIMGAMASIKDRPEYQTMYNLVVAFLNA